MAGRLRARLSGLTPENLRLRPAADSVSRDDSLVRTDGGARLDFEISREAIIPDLRGTHRILDGDARRRFGVLGESWAQKSQEKFGKAVSVGQTLILLAAFGVGSGLGFVVVKYGVQGGSGGGVEVPIQITAAALGVAL